MGKNENTNENEKSEVVNVNSTGDCGTCQWIIKDGVIVLENSCAQGCFCPLGNNVPPYEPVNCIPDFLSPSDRRMDADDKLFLVFDSRKVVILGKEDEATSGAFEIPVGEMGYGWSVNWHHNPVANWDLDVTPREGQVLPNAEVDVSFPNSEDELRVLFTDTTSLRTFRLDHWSVSLFLVTEKIIF